MIYYFIYLFSGFTLNSTQPSFFYFLVLQIVNKIVYWKWNYKIWCRHQNRLSNFFDYAIPHFLDSHLSENVHMDKKEKKMKSRISNISNLGDSPH